MKSRHECIFQMKLRKATMAELDEVTELAQKLFPRAKVDFRSDDEVIIAEENNRIIGFVHIRKIKGKCIIRGIGVEPGQRNTGVGSALMAHALAALKDEHAIYLKVKEENVPALALYSKYGFILKKYGKIHLLAKLKPT